VRLRDIKALDLCGIPTRGFNRIRLDRCLQGCVG
jgi:hypothetical protein